MFRRMYRTARSVWHIFKTEGGGECGKISWSKHASVTSSAQHPRAKLSRRAALLVHPSCVVSRGCHETTVPLISVARREGRGGGCGGERRDTCRKARNSAFDLDQRPPTRRRTPSIFARSGSRGARRAISLGDSAWERSRRDTTRTRRVANRHGGQRWRSAAPVGDFAVDLSARV